MSAAPEAGGAPGNLSHARGIECELVRRNREIAHIRDLLRQREGQVEDWKGRHGELVGRLADLDGELTKLRLRTREVEARREQRSNELEDERSSRDLIQETATTQLAELQERFNEATCALETAATEHASDRAAVEVAERQRVEEERRTGKALQELEAAQQETQKWRRRAETAEASALTEQRRDEEVAAALADVEFSRQMATLEEKASVERIARLAAEARLEKVGLLERQARLDANARLEPVERERDEVSTELTKVSNDLKEAKARIVSAARMRDEIAEQMTKVAGELNDAKTKYSVASRERKEAVREFKEMQKLLARKSSELEASKEACLAQSLQATANEMRLWEEIRHADERKEIAERELVALARTPQAIPSRLEAKARILQTENDALRAEAGVARRRQRELSEGNMMAAEEMRGRQVQAAATVSQALARESRSRINLEETRRARSVDMTALVKKLCKPESSPEVLLKSVRPGGG